MGGAVVLGPGAGHWARAPGGPASPESPALDEEIERRIDDELERFDG